MIHLIPDRYVWPQITATPVIPPPLKTLPDMPKFTRRKKPDKRPKGTRGSSVVCRECGLLGHNKRTCKGPRLLKTTEDASSSQPQLQPWTLNQSQLTVHLD
ncbi:hypothetical protein ACOSP7_019556 [Xanthoceras sorbifolium]